MASLQAYQSHGIRYWRIVESYRKDDGKPTLRVLAHLGRVDDILQLHQGTESPTVKVSSVSAGAVTALYRLAEELDLAARIDRAVAKAGAVQKRDGLSVGQSLLAAIIARACAPRSKRAFAEWAKGTYLPELMGFKAEELTSQHFWDQMQALPVAKLAQIEQQLVGEVVRREQLKVRALAYDTTNFYTHIASTNLHCKLPQRGHNKQRRHDLRQMGLALVVDQDTRYPLAHALYEGARSDMRSFAEFLKPLRRHLSELSVDAEQLTLVFDAGSSSKANLLGVEQYVTAVRPSDHRALLAEASAQLAPVLLASGTEVHAWRTSRPIAGREREVVIVLSPPLHAGQLRGLRQSLDRCVPELTAMLASSRLTEAAAKRKLARLSARQYLGKLLCYEVTSDARGELHIRLWCDVAEYQRLLKSYFGLRVLITDRREWSTAQIIEAYRGQSKVEAAFRDLKDPHMLATRPQFHWTDQKLHVHVFLCVIAYLLVTMLHRRAVKHAAFDGSARRLLAELTQLRCCRLIDVTGRKGRPRARWQVEETGTERRALLDALNAMPALA
jgi:transposase